MSLYRCAACGSPNVILDTQTGGVEYNYLKGAIGTAVLGVGGAAAGIQSSKQQVFKCPDCGMTLNSPMPEEIKLLIDLGVNDVSARSHLTLQGVPVYWDILTTQYKNIEHGRGDAIIEAQKRAMKSERELFAFCGARRPLVRCQRPPCGRNGRSLISRSSWA